MEQQDKREDVVEAVRQLGFVFSYLGTGNLIDAVLLCLQEPEALTAVTKQVYPAIARQTGAKWKNVERNMRTTVDIFWDRGNRELLNQMAGFEIRVRPSVGETISYIVGYFRQQETKS